MNGVPAGQDKEADFLLRVGERVRNRRKALGYSQERLEELSEVSLNTIRRIETKHMSVGLLAYYFVAHALRIPMSDLLAEGESGDHRLEEMNAAWHSILHEHDRHVIYVTFMAMISAIEDIQDKKL